MLTIRVGGSTDSEDTEVTVMPEISLPRPAVMTLTPPARWRMAPRNSPAETSRSILMVRTAEFMATSLALMVRPRIAEGCAGSSLPAPQARRSRAGGDAGYRHGRH